MSGDFTFPKSRRLQRSADFQRVYARNVRVSDPVLLICADLNADGPTRIGLSVSRKHGNAVRRQRIKRLLREAFRLEQHNLPAGLDLILIPRVGAAAGLSDLRCSLVRLAKRLPRRLVAPPATTPLTTPKTPCDQ